MCWSAIRNALNGTFHIVTLTFLSYLLATIPIQIVNILGLSMMKHFWMGLLMQGCLQTGIVIGILLSPFIQLIISYKTLLILCSFVMSLHPIVYPVTSVWNNLDYVSLVFILAGVSGVGISIFQYNQYLNLLSIHQSSSNSCYIGVQNSIFILNFLFASIILCFFSLSISNIDLWMVSLSLGIVYIFTILFVSLLKKPNISLEFNHTKLFKYSKFWTAYFNIGVIFMQLCKALVFSVFPYHLYSDIGFTQEIYSVGLYFLFTSTGLAVGNLVCALSFRIKYEKVVLIGSFILGLLGIVPLIFESYFNSKFDNESIYWFIAVVFACQIGAVDCFTLRIVAGHSLMPRIQLVFYVCFTAGVWALLCFFAL